MYLIPRGTNRTSANRRPFRLRRVWIFIIVLIGTLVAGVWESTVMADWRTASREPVGIAPDPVLHPEAIVQVYAARAVGWRGVFGVHTWIASKRTAAPSYQVYEVLGWRLYSGGRAVVTSGRAPDGRWFGSIPEILAEVRGPRVDAMIDRIEDAIARYPYADAYTIWPGPNSNTFTAYVGREVPELTLDLPPTAIGKDYPVNGIVARAPSGTGFQVSLKGLLGLIVAADEGIEFNLLGLTFGLDLTRPAIKLPIAGRLGFSESLDMAPAAGPKPAAAAE